MFLLPVLGYGYVYIAFSGIIHLLNMVSSGPVVLPFDLKKKLIATFHHLSVLSGLPHGYVNTLKFKYMTLYMFLH